MMESATTVTTTSSSSTSSVVPLSLQNHHNNNANHCACRITGNNGRTNHSLPTECTCRNHQHPPASRTGAGVTATVATRSNAPLLPQRPPDGTTTLVRGWCHRSHCLYLIGSGLYVSLAVWDLHKEQSWYVVAVDDNYDDDHGDTAVTTSITASWNATVLSDDHDHDDDHSTQHWNHLFVFVGSFVRTIFHRMDLYLLLSILAASCYVIDAVSFLWSMCRNSPPLTVTATCTDHQHHDPLTNSSPENDEINNPIRRIDHERGSSSSLHRFQQQTHSNHNHSRRTLWIALTFGMGATLDLLAACTTETVRYPNVSTYAVVGAAHAYFTNAILVVSHQLQYSSTITTRLSGRTPSQKVTFMADGLFLIGSMVDVALSYFYIGENWDASITVWVYIYRGYLVSSLLWLLNAILYIVADIICVDHTDSSMTSNNSQGSTMVRKDTVSTKHVAQFEQNQYQDSHCDPQGNVDPVSLLFDHSLLLAESTTMTTEQLPSRDDTSSTASASTASFTHGGDDVYILSV